MPEARDRSLRERVLRAEPFWVFALGAAALAAIPLSLGYLGLSWDALNHHIYLGWVAEHARFDLDYLAASYQSYQFPYLYWPVYKLAMSGASGTVAGLVLALLHALAIPPLWMIARSCIPGNDLFTAGMRATGVMLGFMTAAVLSLFDSTSNDLMASIPLLWAYAFALRPIERDEVPALRWIALSGALAGLSVACKVSNGFLAMALPLLWLWPRGGPGERVGRTIVGGACLLASTVLFYGYWGWQLWSRYGNPVYPLYDGYFGPLRSLLGWQG